jgi:hypothetical protein
MNDHRPKRSLHGDLLKGNGKVIRIGFEPMTYSLEGCRSIQLSYRTGDAKLIKPRENGNAGSSSGFPLPFPLGQSRTFATS